ncbi:hypothetical protein MHZ95_19865 [Sporosarcina sp. ACRSM]|uniref:hypothetical protein n=1 Tax=Sporosarcina sp. ACRSM TaxID=2918216 RepID=UPI001EF6ABFA|nr:hypothetical protein [Sporosarcina sp. ACRSM]MCG7337520.1 hypothetical protein [Sporosarcina sp. ACRSM]
MGKTVTFSFSSSNYDGTEATESFSLEQLGIDEDMNDDKALEIAMEKFFEAWVWDKLNISCSIVIEEENACSTVDFQEEK